MSLTPGEGERLGSSEELLLASLVKLGARCEELSNRSALLAKVLVLVPSLEELFELGDLVRGHWTFFLGISSIHIVKETRPSLALT